MQKLETLRQTVEQLYTTPHPDADVWIDWGYPNHVLFVAELAASIATAQGANVEQVVAGALLHDIADAVMPAKVRTTKPKVWRWRRSCWLAAASARTTQRIS